MRYNLLEESWIPILRTDGRVERVGILQALTEAGNIRQIAASNPMDRLAVLRFLLALLYWCKRDPPATTDAASRGAFPLDWFSILAANRECFNLLGAGKRFYQYRKEDDKTLTANYLVHEIPAGTNFWHFRHATDKVNGLCPACCAIGLLRLPLFSTQGGQGKSPGINARPPIYVIPTGETLAETLRLSWRPVSNLGRPAWEDPDLQLPRAGEVPLLAGLTWLPRRVWLDEPRESAAPCISCGRQGPVILSSIFAGKGSTKTDSNAPGRIWRDPSVVYEQTKTGEMSLHAADPIGNPDVGAGQWARILAGLLRNPQKERGTAWVVGFSTDQNKYFEAAELSLPWPGLPDQVELCAKRLNQWQQSGFDVSHELKESGKRASSLKHPEIQSAVAAIRPQVESMVAAQASDLLTGGDLAWRRAGDEYRPLMKMVAGGLAPGFTTADVERRRRIANALPLGENRRQARKPSARKGGAA